MTLRTCKQPEIKEIEALYLKFKCIILDIFTQIYKTHKVRICETKLVYLTLFGPFW